MVNWYAKGQSDYLAPNFHMGFYIDHNGFAEGDYESRVMETHGETSDPFMAFGIDTGPASWTYGQQQAEIGLLKSHRIKIDTTGCYKWVGPGQDDWALLEAGGSAGNLNDLDDVVIDGTPADNELLAWDTSSSKWINQTPSEAGLIGSGDIIPQGEPATGNLKLGTNALASLTTADYSIAIGNQAAEAITDKNGTVAIGYEALHLYNAGVDNIMIGYQAGRNLGDDSNSNYNIGIGSGALYSVRGEYNIGIGHQAGNSLNTADYNVLIGYMAGAAVTAFPGNTLIGYNVASSYNSRYLTAIGSSAGAGATACQNSVLIGANAGSTSNCGQDNVVIGYDAMAFGYSAFVMNGCVAIGYQAGRYTQGSNWVGVGNGANQGTQNYDSSDGVFIGFRANYETGDQKSVIIGYEAGYYDNRYGTENVWIGYKAGYGTNTRNASNNIGIGGSAHFLIQTGDNNVAIGYNAGYSLVNGSGNIMIGYQAGFNETGSDTLYIHNTNTATPLILGDFTALTETLKIHSNSTLIATFDKDTLTMGKPIAMGTNKITGLGAATENGDAVRFEQIHAEQHAMDSATYHTRTDITTLDASISFHGFLKKLDGTATNYMDGSGNWSVPAGGSGDSKEVSLQHVEDTGLVLSSTIVITSADEDLSFTFGRFGIVGVSDYVYFGHRDHVGTSDYAMRVAPGGGTVLNAYSGQTIQFAIQNSPKMNMSATSLTLTAANLIITDTTKTAGSFYAGTTDPTNTNRLNYDGYLYATKLYVGSTEVVVHTEDHDNTHHTTNYHTESDGTGVVTVHSGITDAGSGIIISDGERTALHAIYTLEQHNNTYHSTNYHSESDGTGIVTVHSDVTSVGSGAIITTAERNALHTKYTDDEAAAKIALDDLYVKNTTDSMSGNLTVAGYVKCNEVVPDTNVADTCGTQALTWLRVYTRDLYDSGGNQILGTDDAGKIDQIAEINADITMSSGKTVDGKDVGTLIATVVEDTTPQLGGQLDLNDKGITHELTAAVSLVAGDLCYMNGVGKMDKAQADAEDTCDTLLAMCLDTISADATGTFLIFGKWTTTGLTAGIEYWVSDITAGDIIATKPSSTGDIIRHVGTSLSTTVLFFNPSHTYVEYTT